MTLDFAPLAAAIDALDPARAATLDRLVRETTVGELADAAVAGDVSARELVAFHLGRIRDLDGPLRSVVAVNPAAFDIADRLDALAASGGRAGALHGVPVLLKDNIATGDGMPVTVGAAALRNHRAPDDAPIVARLRAAGAVIIGKTNLSEWAYFMSSDAPSGYSAVGGQTVNPFGPGLAVSGSSSGSAVAAAMRFAPLTIGTETTGSIVAPAAANGVAGMRPSSGLVDGALIAPISPELDGPGPIARRVADLATVLEVLASEPSGPAGPLGSVSRDVSLAGLRFGVPVVGGMDPAAAGGRPFTRTIEALRGAGATVFAIEVPEVATAALAGAQRALFAGGMRAAVDAWLVRTGAPVGSLAEIVAWNAGAPAERAPHGQDLLEGAVDADTSPADQAARMDAYRTTALRTIVGLAAEHRLDALLSVDNLFSLFYAGAGVAAVTLPIGRDDAGQPRGTTLVAVRRDDDAALLGIARAVERVAGTLEVPGE